MHKIEWEGDPHPEFNEIIQAEISGLLARGLGRASDLFFHHIDLDDDLEGRAIFVSGKSGDDETYYVEYVSQAKSVPLSDD